MFFHCYLYRIPFLFLLCAMIASSAGIASPVMEKGHPCRMDCNKRLEKNVVVESRESCRFECDLLLNRLFSLIGIDPSFSISRHWKWQRLQPFLNDRSYSRCNLSILASKHHPPTL